MDKMKKLMIIVALCIATCTLWAQNEVSLVVSGEGKDKEEATFKALRSAIEQAYGTFVSANTTVLNDQLVADEIVSLSSGNIQKYEYVSENKMPSGNTFVTLSATVSIDKLVSFAESKGMETELKGGLFAMNIKKMEFDKQSEEKAVENLCKQLEVMLPSLFDYEIKVMEPVVSVNPKVGPDGRENAYDQDKVSDYEVDFEVFVSPTENLLSFYSILVNALYRIGLSKSELEKYHSINMPVFLLGNDNFEYIERAITHYNNISSPNYTIPFISDFQMKHAEENIDYDFLHSYIYRHPKAAALRQVKDFNKIEILEYLSFLISHTHLRSEKSIDLFNDFIDKSLFELYNFIISDDLRDFELFVSKTNIQNPNSNIELPDWLAVPKGRKYSSHLVVWNLHEYIPICFLNAKMTRGGVNEKKTWLLLLDIEPHSCTDCFSFESQFYRIDKGNRSQRDRIFNSDFHPAGDNCPKGKYGEGKCSGLHLLKGKLFYNKEEISKITHVSVSKPVDIFKDYLKDETTGIYYKFYDEIHKEAARPKTGDLVGIRYSMRTEDAILIPMTKNEMVMDSVDKNDLYAAIRMMHVGDSATFIFNGQVFFDQIMTEEYPFGEEPLYIDIKLYGQMSKEGFEKLKLQKMKDKEIVHAQSKLPLYNDTLQQAVNDYNALLKQYPYNYNENLISYSLSSELPNDEVVLRDTLHTLLKIISDKKAQLVERYKKDSLEFKQMSQSLQDKIDETNVQLLQYPYNVQKRTLKDSLPISLFGKTEELGRELQTKVAALPKMQEQTEKEVYEKLKVDDPQRFTEIFFAQNPSKKQEVDKSYIECRCKYKYRLDFDMAFINNTLPDCDCREKEYLTVSKLFHTRKDFDQMYSQEESSYNLELNNLKSMMADKKAIEEILFNSKQLNFKKSLHTSNEDLKSIVDRINKHKGKYYYTDVIDVVFKLNDKLAKEWEKNGTYFKSKAEMFEYWIGEEYDKVLKARKKE